MTGRGARQGGKKQREAGSEGRRPEWRRDKGRERGRGVEGEREGEGEKQREGERKG